MRNRSMFWVVVGCAVVIFFLAIPPWLSSVWRVRLLQAFSPILAFERGVVDIPSAIGRRWSTHRRLSEDNRLLRGEIAALTRELLGLRDCNRENMRLRGLLKFKESSPFSLLPARVVGRDTRQWNSSILVDKGSSQGVREGMAVVSQEGVVGRIMESAPSISKVVLLISARSRVGGIVERTRETGVVEGTSFGTCRLIYLPRNTAARGGDRVLTSGLGGIYPKGLAVGVCTGVYEGEYGLYSCADVAPAVDFSRLEEVCVLLSSPGGPPR